MHMILAAVFMFATTLLGAELSVGRVTTAVGTKVNTPIHLKAEGAPITTIQVDLEYDETVLSISSTIGPAAEKASKQLAASDPAKNRKRFMLFGLNQNIIEDGPIVVLTIEVKPDAAQGDHPLKLVSAGASNAAAARIVLRVVDGSLTVK